MFNWTPNGVKEDNFINIENFDLTNWFQTDDGTPD